MARNKSNVTPHYEMLYIISNKYTEEEIKPIMEKIAKTITDNEGEITFEESWGKKKLAYAIKHFNYGYYNLVEFNLPGKNLIEVDKIFRMSQEILRHQIITRPFRTPEEIEKEKADDKARRDSEVEGIEEKETEKKETKIKKTETKKKEKVEKPKTSKEEKVDLEKLDEKLDKILETDDLL